MSTRSRCSFTLTFLWRRIPNWKRVGQFFNLVSVLWIWSCTLVPRCPKRTQHLDLFLSPIALPNLTGVCRSWPIPFRYVIIAHLDPTHTWTTRRREVSVPQCPMSTTTSLSLPPVHICLPTLISTHSLWDIPSLWILWGVRLSKNQVTGNSKSGGFMHSFPQTNLALKMGRMRTKPTDAA